jgi:1-acyl-sn-glycerol-3-phosphate acyltransferase
MLPPRLIRRLVLAPLVIVIALAFIVLSPFLALLALVFGLAAWSRPGRMRSLRLTCFALVWFVAETAALFMLLGLWIVSGFGGRLRTEPYQSRHYGVIRWFLDVMYDGAARTYGLRVEVDEPELTPDERIARLARPVIVLSRHAGPGDSFLLIHELLSVYGRRPRVVMKSELQLDPSLDVVGNRLPNVFIQHSKAGESLYTEQIERLAAGLGPTGALVIFPEGANWTPGRWRRGIRRLEHDGRSDLAAKAKDMPNLLPPRPGGTLAAIKACPDADVIFVAHAGLDNIVSVGDVWRNFPIDQVIRARWWRVPHDAVPRTATHDAQVQWLYDWWKLIDSWISHNRPGGIAVPEEVPEHQSDTAEPVTELSALAILQTVGEPTPCDRGEPEYRALTVLCVTDKDMAGIVGNLDAVAGRRIGALDPFQ